MAINEYWHDTFHGCIPPDPHYSMKLTQGEETGLLINLESLQNNVVLEFGNVQAINILDEGTQLSDPPGITTTNLQQLRQSSFSSVIYQVDNGAYEAYIKSLMTPELYEFYDLRQYNIVTMNYVVEIIAFSEPTITINK